MKRFNISTGLYDVYGKILPKNCVYGKFVTEYKTPRKDIAVRDKSRHDTLDNFKIVRKSQSHYTTLVYYCDDFAPVSVDGYTHYYVHIYDYNRDRWNDDVCTCQDRKYYDLAKFLHEMFTKLNITPEITKCEQIRTKHVMLPGAPREKKHQVFSDSPFRVSPKQYALYGECMITNASSEDWTGGALPHRSITDKVGKVDEMRRKVATDVKPMIKESVRFVSGFDENNVWTVEIMCDVSKKVFYVGFKGYVEKCDRAVVLRHKMQELYDNGEITRHEYVRGMGMLK